LDNVGSALWAADAEFVGHPIECMDVICVSDLATWTVHKMTYLTPKLPFYSDAMAAIHGKEGSANSTYMRHAIGTERQGEFFSPLGVLLSHLYSKLAWTFPDMRSLEEYFRRVNLLGAGEGAMRQWNISIYSKAIRDRVHNGGLSNGASFDEWSIFF
jgi:hypothetical protein